MCVRCFFACEVPKIVGDCVTRQPESASERERDNIEERLE